jgi:hypothetical protein
MVLAALLASVQMVTGQGAMAMAPADSAKLEMVVDSSAKTIVLTVGPFDLPDRTGEDTHMHSGAGHDTPVYHFDWPIEGWLRGFELQAFDGDGNVLPQRIVHHMIMVNFDRRQLIYRAAERILGSGTETAGYELPKSIGVPVRPGSDLGMYIAWHNTTGARIEEAYFQLTLSWIPKNQVPQPVSGLPVYFDVNLTIGGTNTYDIPAGRSEKSYEFTLPVSGRLLGVGGHMHDYGVEVRLEDAESDKVITTVKAEVDTNGWVVDLERHLFGVSGRGKKLKANHPYRVVAVYDNPTGSTLELGAMAHMVGLYAPDDIDKWPAIDLEDPVYQKDLASLADQFSKITPMNMQHEKEDEHGDHEHGEDDGE